MQIHINLDECITNMAGNSCENNMRMRPRKIPCNCQDSKKDRPRTILPFSLGRIYANIVAILNMKTPIKPKAKELAPLAVLTSALLDTGAAAPTLLSSIVGALVTRAPQLGKVLCHDACRS